MMDILHHTTGFAVDFVIQNLSTNNVYFSDIQVTTSTGIKIIPGGMLSKDNWESDIWLVADGATSDVRICYQVKKTGAATPAEYVMPLPRDSTSAIQPGECQWPYKGKSV